MSKTTETVIIFAPVAPIESQPCVVAWENSVSQIVSQIV